MEPTCNECNSPRSVCANCDSPSCQNVVCAQHVHRFGNLYLCWSCYYTAFAAQQPKFVYVRAHPLLERMRVPN